MLALIRVCHFSQFVSHLTFTFSVACVFFHLISSRARWRENRTIFNTPNPRLMNVSLLRENKLMHNQERRGSRMSMRMPSRQPSMVSLRQHSPNPSIGRQGLYTRTLIAPGVFSGFIQYSVECSFLLHSLTSHTFSIALSLFTPIPRL